MKKIFIINPISGNGHGLKAGQKIETLLQKKTADNVTIYTEYSGHARALASEWQHKAERIVVVGGDGTLNEVVNGIDKDSTDIALIPTGTGNDYAAFSNVPFELEQALALAQNGIAKKVDLGKVTASGQAQLFINALGIGFDAMVADFVHNFKYFTGMTAYALALVKALFVWHSPQMRTDTDSGNAFLINIGIGSRVGGGFYLSPEARADDALFDICRIRPFSLIQAPVLLKSILQKKHPGLSYVDYWQQDQLKISIARPVSLHCDGQMFPDKATELVVEMLPSRLAFVKP
jgi:diacylglycerol kinase (ATP)